MDICLKSDDISKMQTHQKDSLHAVLSKQCVYLYRGGCREAESKLFSKMALKTVPKKGVKLIGCCVIESP